MLSNDDTETNFQQETATRFRLPPRIRPSSLMKAHIALLEQEIIQPTNGELFSVVSYHLPALQKWHGEHTGWYIEQHSNMFRLLRSPSILTSNSEKNKLQESRDFAYLTWILSYAARRQLTGYGVEQQFLLSHLGQYIADHTQKNEDEEGLTLERRADRFSLVRALKYLEEINGLRRVAGQTKEWIDRQADILYEFTSVTSLFITALDLEAIAPIDDRLQHNAKLQPALLSPIVSPLVRAWRALLLSPVFLRYDDPEGFAALYVQAEDIERSIMETFGWLLEVNTDYACIISSGGTSTETTPLLHLGSATDQIVALLCTTLYKEVAENRLVPDSYGCVSVLASTIESLFITNIRPRFGMHWGKEAQETSGTKLLADAYKKMRHIGLLRGPNEIGEILLLPVAARFESTYITAQRDADIYFQKRQEKQEHSSIEASHSSDLWSETNL